ncbi:MULTISPECIES: SoxR-reducing system protein RseC [Erwinia]|jgi:sigma-E factor negative regulatory protein RseC|uniref:Sigma-E factor regulatory protein n=1 Tax=Erwinia billingiae (strain Eb661) TaxID=634500 RepID=D8MVU0_ERWBE|nr:MULTISPECIES: SoxR-reducing system protein RseC [Erwinia]MBN7122656.1 SoxR reducing system protein RseC [Erwinia billingiae]PRB57363.1 SoxR reducing system protein RseC [Erwinia billingiae]QBR48763.1 SoxR-reducing system protein RseC [Erwinia sp. QL-Z3]QEW31145.1 SoxR-reducing system protein RseC [Erwinia billingiae]CAX60947.1 Sigma-E factor regulatory protein [Erwinia billingiae Eb661]
MMREWATVVSWNNGIATLHSEIKTSCSSCSARKGCGSHMLDKLGPKNAHVMKVASAEPLAAGQRIELGIAEKSLLSSALLVYMTPLVGLFIVAGLFQALFHTDIAAVSGALLGGVGGFILAKGISTYLGKSASFQPVILSVALPPDALRVETDR